MIDMKPQKMLISLSLANDEGICRAVTSDIDPEHLKDVIVEMHDQLLNKEFPTF